MIICPGCVHRPQLRRGSEEGGQGLGAWHGLQGALLRGGCQGISKIGHWETLLGVLRVPVPAQSRAVHQVDLGSLRLLGCGLWPRQRGSALPQGKGEIRRSQRKVERFQEKMSLLGGRGQESLHPNRRGVETCGGSDWWLCGPVLYSYTELTAEPRGEDNCQC